MVGLRESAEHGDHRPMGELGILIRFDHEALDHFCVSLNHGGFLVNAQKELKRAPSRRRPSASEKYASSITPSNPSVVSFSFRVRICMLVPCRKLKEKSPASIP